MDAGKNKLGKTNLSYESQRNILAEIYNKLSILHDKERKENYDNSEDLLMLSRYLPRNAKVLDAGCGTGYPVIKFFHDLGHDVTGTDISPGQLSFVKLHAPRAKTMICDTSELDFLENTFDLVTSFYSLMHLSLDRQITALEKFYKIVKINQPIYVTLATKEYTGSDVFAGNILYGDTPLPIYHTTPEEYYKILNKIGYKNISLTTKNTGRNIILLWAFGIK